MSKTHKDILATLSEKSKWESTFRETWEKRCAAVGHLETKGAPHPIRGCTVCTADRQLTQQRTEKAL